jgi:hypothetical protein
MVPLLRMPQGPDKDAKHNAVVLKKGIEVGRNENVRTDDAKIRRRSGQGKEQREEKLYVYLEVNMIDDNETRMEEERGRDDKLSCRIGGSPDVSQRGTQAKNSSGRRWPSFSRQRLTGEDRSLRRAFP